MTPVAYLNAHGSSGQTVRRVVAMRRKNPCATMAEIGARVGVSRQRVSLILTRAGLPTRAVHPKKSWECPVCGRVTEHRFCSDACLRAWHRVPLICDNCGKVYYRLRSTVTKAVANSRRHSFCSQRCHGAWLGKNFGGHWQRSTNHARVRQVYLLSGWPPGRVAEYLGLKYNTVTSILYKLDRQRAMAATQPSDFMRLH